MARRLCFDERVRIEAMSAAGFSAAAVAQRLGRHRATIQRESAGNGGSFAYRGRRRAGGGVRQGAPVQAPQAGPTRRTGRGCGRAPRVALVAAGDQR